MARQVETRAGRMRANLRQGLSRVEFLALFPFLTLLAAGFGGADLVLVTAFLLPALLALQSVFGPARGVLDGHGDTGRGPETGIDAVLDRLAQITASSDMHDTACILVQIDEWDGVIDLWGGEAASEISSRAFDRVASAMRNTDFVTRLGESRFAIVLGPVSAARLGIRDSIVTRLRGAFSDAFAIAGGSVRLSISVGHTNLLKSADDPANATLSAAEAALAEAHREGPDAVRAYAPGLETIRHKRHMLSGEVEDALQNGQIRPWFQPQLNTATGAISGFEALARWHHPERGVLPPGEFLPAVADAGCMEALGHSILFHSLHALKSWDDAGLRVPSVSVNFSTTELRNPRLIDRVKWEIDRFEMHPARLTVEILETVAAESRDDTVISTLTALGAHGVNLDLDDFGIGQASLSAIRRFGVSRIKIDRSFVMGMEDDPEQQSMVSAILAMAQHLGIETLAEGVETTAVQDMLTKMGCNHVQGYLIARPMPLEETFAWTSGHNSTVLNLNTHGRHAS